MRLRVYGISQIALALFGLLPAFIGYLFHYESFLYRPIDAIWFSWISLAIAFVFIFFFQRGVFRARYLILSVLFTQISFECFSAVLDRSFLKLGLGILAFILTVLLSVWIERKVKSACLNPKVKWFEGAPLAQFKMDARIRLNQDWVPVEVRAIDQKGFFVFLGQTVSFHPKQVVSFELRFKENHILGDANLMASFKGEKMGFGLQFLPKDLYHFSQYTALVQRLKGEGLLT